MNYFAFEQADGDQETKINMISFEARHIMWRICYL